MAIAHHATTITYADWPSSGARSFTVDTGSGDDLVLCVLAYLDRGSTTTINGATYNGATMAAEAAVLSTSGFDTRLFYLPAPATGSNTLTVTCSDDNAKVGVVVSVYTGVDQTTPLASITGRFSTTIAGNSYSAAQTTELAQTAVMMILSFDSGGSTTFYAPYGAMVERLDNYGFVADIAANDTSMTVGFTPTSAAIFAGYSFALAPSGASVGVPKTSKQTLLGVG